MNVVILGETGVGKSTFINAFANYLQSQSLQEMLNNPNKVISLMATEFQMTDPDTGKLVSCKFGEKSAEENRAVQTVGASFTQSCKTYSFSVGRVTIRIVDTPGLVDARGYDQDNININAIMSYLQHFEKVHAFLFLFRAETVRMQAAFVYCFKAFLNKLHKDAVQNIIFVNSHARPCLYNPSGTAAILDQILEDVRRESRIELYRQHSKTTTDANDFYIDSEAFRLLVAHLNGIKFSTETVKEFSASWNHSSKVSKKIFEYARTLTPHKVSSTRSIHTVQIMYQALVQPMVEIKKTIAANLARAEDEKEELKTTQLSIEDLRKKVFMKMTFLETTTLAHPRTVCTHADCTKLQTVAGETLNVHKVCHDECQLEPNYQSLGHPALMKCVAFSPNHVESSKCTECGHTFHLHRHTNVEYKQVEKTVENPVIKKKIDDSMGAVSIQEEMVLDNEEMIETLQASMAQIEQTSLKTVCYLQQNSIVPVNDSLLKYLDTEIRLRESDPKSADMLNTLKDWRNSHDEQIKTFKRLRDRGEAKIITIEEINKHLEDMFQLPDYGEKLKETHKKITEKDSMHYQEYSSNSS